VYSQKNVCEFATRHTPLLNAVKSQQHDIAKRLLGLGSDPNGGSFSMTTPLMMAASKDDLEMVESCILLFYIQIDFVLICWMRVLHRRGRFSSCLIQVPLCMR
jgi:hypothetical protein